MTFANGFDEFVFYILTHFSTSIIHLQNKFNLLSELWVKKITQIMYFAKKKKRAISTRRKQVRFFVFNIFYSINLIKTFYPDKSCENPKRNDFVIHHLPT